MTPHGLETLQSSIRFGREDNFGQLLQEDHGKIGALFNVVSASTKQQTSNKRSRIFKNKLVQFERSNVQEWKKNVSSLIYTYQTQSNLSDEIKKDLTLLSEELICKSIYELREKYRNFVFDAMTDDFYIEIINLILSSSVEELSRREIANLSKTIKDEQYAWAPVQRDEMLRILIHVLKGKWSKQGRVFNCYVLDYRELHQFLDRHHEQSAPFSLIIRNEVHYTAIDFKDNRATILDASQDPKHKIIESLLRQRNYEVLTCGASDQDLLQTDTRSCSIFSLQHVKDACKRENFTHQPSINSNGRIAWSNLHHSFIRNAQDPQFINRYLSQFSAGEAQAIRQYIDTKGGIEKSLIVCRQVVDHFLANNTAEDVAEIACHHPFAAL